jgi:predicted AlkP superfamily phosphohydrolase/phosphomutase
MSKAHQLILIGLDAADPVLVDRWIQNGSLPTLGWLKNSGTYGRLDTSAKYLTGSPWPTFYTGQLPCQHGIYEAFQWRHEKMDFAIPTYDWIPATPFWRHLEKDLAVITYDVPMVQGCQAAKGIEICGWAGHDNLVPLEVHPPALLAGVKSRFGSWPMARETFGPSSLDELLGLKENLLENIKRSTDLAIWLLQHPWNLAVIVFGALHRGGHRLWDQTSLKENIPARKGNIFDRALKDLYIACDDAVGQLIAAAPEAAIMVFSLHGMMKNTSRIDLLDNMLARVLSSKKDSSVETSLLRRLAEASPNAWRRYLTQHMPDRYRNQLMTLWMTGRVDWKNTRAFPLRADLQGYIRMNMQGREPKGIVPPGGVYDELCVRISTGLKSFLDSSNGRAVIEEVCRPDEVFGIGPRRDRLPDLIIRWQDTPAGEHSRIESEHYGWIQRKTSYVPNGRSGNHRPEGFFIACGRGIPAGAQLQEKAHIVDLAPTILRYLGTQTSLPLCGKFIAELTDQG